MKGTTRLVVVLGSIALGCATALAFVEKATRDPIAYQLKLELVESLRLVLPGQTVDPDRPLQVEQGPMGVPVTVYRAAGDGGVGGVAFKVSDSGYAGAIVVMMGVLPDGTLGGVEILEQKETPGLGNRIAEAGWKGQFGGKSLENAAFKVRKDGGDFDQITGATISPRAVVRAVERGLAWFGGNRGLLLAAEGGKEGGA